MTRTYGWDHFSLIWDGNVAGVVERCNRPHQQYNLRFYGFTLGWWAIGIIHAEKRHVR